MHEHSAVTYTDKMVAWQSSVWLRLFSHSTILQCMFSHKAQIRDSVYMWYLTEQSTSSLTVLQNDAKLEPWDLVWLDGSAGRVQGWKVLKHFHSHCFHHLEDTVNDKSWDRSTRWKLVETELCCQWDCNNCHQYKRC